MGCEQNVKSAQEREAAEFSGCGGKESYEAQLVGRPDSEESGQMERLMRWSKVLRSLWG